MYLIFDTETTGFSASARVVQLAWEYYDKEFNLVDRQCIYVKPDGWSVSDNKFLIENGFSDFENNELGIPIADALAKFSLRYHECAYYVCHNTEFDMRMVKQEGIRISTHYHLPKRIPICTMKSGENFMSKRPKLSELYSYLFKEEMTGAHHAMEDVKATCRIFFELKKRGLTKI